MQLKFRSYPFDANTTLISTRIESVWNEGGQVVEYKWSWDVQGYLAATAGLSGTAAQSDLSTKQTALVVALQNQRGDLIFYCDDGATQSASTLPNSTSLTGVKITHGPDFTKTEGPEYATERHFAFTAEAEYLAANAASLLYSWTETLAIEGGGPTFVHRASINGPAQKQMLYRLTPYKATQQGTIVGYRAYPVVPSPAFPGALKQAGKFSRTSPHRRNTNSFEQFALTYSYEFESVSPLNALPRFWLN